MKKVVLEKDESVVHVSYTDPNKYYGITNDNGVFIGFISYDPGGFCVKTLSGVTDGSIMGQCGMEKYLHKVIKSAIALGYGVYEFQSAKAMFISIGKSLNNMTK